MTAGLLLTGGASRRLGVDKATLRLATGETLADRALATLRAACEPVVEVGRGATEARCVLESPPGGGPVAGLLAGVALVGAPVVLFACDYPCMTVDVLRHLARHEGDSLVPVIGGRPQFVCARFGPRAIAALSESFAAGDASFRRLSLPPEWTIVDLPVAAFHDVDTVADVERLHDLERLGD